MSDKLPAILFYTGDWMKDPGVRGLSYGARGLWFDMLCLMWECQPRGYLAVADRPMTLDQLTRLTGGSETALVAQLLSELKAAKVFSTSDKRIIFCRRMVRDELKRLRNIENGRKGGNPLLLSSRGGLTTGLTPLEDENERIPRMEESPERNHRGRSGSPRPNSRPSRREIDRQIVDEGLAGRPPKKVTVPSERA